MKNKKSNLSIWWISQSEEQKEIIKVLSSFLILLMTLVLMSIIVYIVNFYNYEHI